MITIILKLYFIHNKYNNSFMKSYQFQILIMKSILIKMYIIATKTTYFHAILLYILILIEYIERGILNLFSKKINKNLYL